MFKLVSVSLCIHIKTLFSFEGLNPCLERNYIANNHEEETKNLIMGSVKDKASMPVSRRPVIMSATLRSSGVPNIGRRSHIHPIPFLQNNIHPASSSSSTRLKNTNVNVEKTDRVPGLDHPRWCSTILDSRGNCNFNCNFLIGMIQNKAFWKVTLSFMVWD